MQNLILTPLLILFFALSGLGQELSQTVRGTIIDANTRQPIIGAEVIIVNSEPLKGDVTDLDGKFKITKVPLGRIDLRLAYLGYDNTLIPNIVVNSGKEVVLELMMEQAAVDMEEVVVKAFQGNGTPTNSMALISARSISTEEISRMTGSFNDPAIITANYAGVANSGTGGNDIIVRGNSPKYMQWTLEGVPITNPNHFADQNAVLGSTSTLNTNLLATSDFYMGAFPATFGNALSGVYDVKLRNGNNEKREYTFGIGLLGTDLTVEGPLKQGYRGSFLVNYRYSTSSILNDAGLVEVDGNPRFQDAAFKLNLPTQKAGTFSLFGLGGMSDFSIVNATPEDWTTPGDEIMSGLIFEDYEKASYLFNTGLNHTISFGKQGYLKSSLSYSLEGIDDDVYQKTDSLGTGVNSYTSELRKNTYRASSTYHREINPKHTLQAGVIYTLFDQFIDQRMRPAIDSPLSPLVDFDKQLGNLRSYVSWKYRMNDDISLVGGLHNTNVFFNQKHTLEPRLSARWQVNDRNTMSFGYGLHSTMESVHHYFAKIEDSAGNTTQPNKDLDLLKAHHFVLGYEHQFAPGLIGKVEAYYQHLYDLPVENNDTSYYATINEGAEIKYVDLVNEGTGRNYGIELSLQRYFSDGYYLLANTSIYESAYKTLEGITRNTRFNTNYLVNLVGGKEFTQLGKKHNKTLGINARFFMGGGQKVLPILRDAQGNAAVDTANNQYWDYAKAYENDLEDIYQITLSVSYKIARKSATHELFLNLENITNNKGKLTEYYDQNASDGIGNTTQFGLLPNMMYRVYF
jgi:hypothetical protein